MTQTTGTSRYPSSERAAWCCSFRCSLVIACGLLASVALAPTSPAQSSQAWWIGLGVGVGHIGEGGSAEQDGAASAATGALYASYQLGANVFSVRGAGAFELFGEEIADVGILYGRAITVNRWHMSLGVGLALATGRFQDDGLNLNLFCGLSDAPEGCARDEPQVFSTAGVPLEMQAFARLGNIGFGIYGFVNVNSESSFAGATLSVVAGAFR